MLYTGRELDREAGLYYYRARYYDPEIGRFISEDPLGFEAGINFYAYVGNNLVNFNDPDGFAPKPSSLRTVGNALQAIRDLGKAKIQSQANRVQDLTKPGSFNDFKIPASGKK